MSTYVNAAQLSEPDFIERNPSKVTREWIAGYEDLTGKTLYPAQPERLLINNGAYRESLIREAIQDAGKLSLVRFSRKPILDYLGEPLGCYRLAESYASTRVQLTFDTAPQSATTLPAGTSVAAGEVVFVTQSDVLINPQQTTAIVPVVCSSAGVVGNGFGVGQIKTLLQTVDGLNISDVRNLEVSSGGADEESDERYRERIFLASAQFSVAGSRVAYKYFVMSANSRIMDVTVTAPRINETGFGQGLVLICPLYNSGEDGTLIPSAPPAALKNELFNTVFNGDEKLPMNDTVRIIDPSPVAYSIEAELILYQNADSTAIKALATQAAEQHAALLGVTLGNDVVREQIIAKLQLSGVYKTNLITPAQDINVSDIQFARCTGVTIRIVNKVNEAAHG